MRSVWFAVGIVVLVVGATLWYLPIGQPVGSGDTPSTYELVVSANAPLAILTPSLAYTATWSSDSGLAVNVSVYNCGTDSSCGAYASSDRVAAGVGASGHVSWTGKKGNYYAVVPFGLATSTTLHVTVDIPYDNGVPGLAILLIGAILVVFSAATGRARS